MAVEAAVVATATGQQLASAEIAIRDLEIRYPDRGRKRETYVAATDINLSVRKGEFVAIVGKSGCGKTSVLNILASLLPRDVYVGDVTIRGRAPTEMRTEIGYMLARDALLPWRSAIRNVELPLEATMRRGERRERARELLRRVGLEGFEKRLPHQLSQGMRQRVALARTMSTDPAIILADEPFAALDAQTRLNVQEMFLREWETQDRTTILVTHDLQEAILLADRVVIMAGQPGRIAVDQAVELPRPRADHLVDLFTSDTFRQMYHQLFDDLQTASGG